MDKPYFIMIYDPSGGRSSPIVDDEGVMFFETLKHAGDFADQHTAAFTFGYELCRMGDYSDESI